LVPLCEVWMNKTWVKGETNVLLAMQRMNANWTAHILRKKTRYCSKIEGMRRRGRRCKQLLDDLKENRKYWDLKEEAPDRTLWRTGCGRGYGPVTIQTID